MHPLRLLCAQVTQRRWLWRGPSRVSLDVLFASFDELAELTSWDFVCRAQRFRIAARSLQRAQGASWTLLLY